jgi:hypothetical protein
MHIVRKHGVFSSKELTAVNLLNFEIIGIKARFIIWKIVGPAIYLVSYFDVFLKIINIIIPLNFKIGALCINVQ